MSTPKIEIFYRPLSDGGVSLYVSPQFANLVVTEISHLEMVHLPMQTAVRSPDEFVAALKRAEGKRDILAESAQHP